MSYGKRLYVSKQSWRRREKRKTTTTKKREMGVREVWE